MYRRRDDALTPLLFVASFANIQQEDSNLKPDQWMVADVAEGRVDFWVAEQTVTQLFVVNAAERLLQQQGYFVASTSPF
jgi:hypothetical protein